MRIILWYVVASLSILTIGVLGILHSELDRQKYREFVAIAQSIGAVAVGLLVIWSIVKLSNARHAKSPPDPP